MVRTGKRSQVPRGGLACACHVCPRALVSPVIHLVRMREKLMSYASGTMPVGYMECDIFLSSIEDDDHIIALDWIDAYGTGESERGWRLVYPPSNIDLRTPTGERGVVALGGAGMWGEQPAQRPAGRS